MPCQVVAEIGINHNGELNAALALIEAAARAGADYVKFQKRTPDLCVPVEQRDVPRETPWGTMPYIAYRYRMEFDKDDYAIIDAHCEVHGVKWFLSVWDRPSLDFALEWRPDYVKLPSALLTVESLVRAAAGAGVPLVLSTGMSTLDEIQRAVDWASAAPHLTIMHCHSAYPAPSEELNLRCIETLAKQYPHATVGYSGHEFGLEPTVWAVILGAQIVERHITINRSLWGSDQLASVEPLGFERMVGHIRSAERALGDGIKTVWPSEQTAMQRLRPQPAIASSGGRHG